MAIEFRILGPLEVLRDGAAVHPTSRKQRLLLALLLVRANQTVPIGTLVDALWGDRPPTTATGVLQTYISQLRKLIEPVAPTDGARRVLTADPGYRLVVGPTELDAACFERRSSEGRSALRAGRPAEARELLDGALDLWRGPALADVGDEQSLHVEALRLDGLRVVATEDRIEARIALGHHTDLVEELASLVAVHPLRERLWGQLMVCLYRSGRQSEALDAYQRLRHQLAEELGLGPSPELRSLERDILAHASSLDWRPPSTDPGGGATTSAGAATGAGRVGFPPALASERRSAVVGREEASRVLLDAVRRTDASGAFVLVAGEPGVGKTRLVAEAAAVAHGDGALVLFGRCAEELVTPSAPWPEVLTPLVEQADDRLLAAPLERSGSVLARLVPAVTRRFGALPLPPQADAATERLRLADAIADVITAAAVEARLVIVLDDLHWADPMSLALLAHLVHTGAPPGVCVVGTYRDTEVGPQHPLTRTLVASHRHAQVTRLTLTGLARHEIAALVASRVGQEPEDELVTGLEEATQGNPFFIKEVLRHLTETGAYERRDGGWVRTRPVDTLVIPDSVRDVVAGRLASLSEDANQAMRVAAVIGTEVDVGLVGAVAPAGTDVLGGMDEAARAGLLREASGPPGRFSFSHGLVRQTLLTDLPGGRRASVHWRVGEALARSRPEHVDEIAYHLTEGVLAGDPSRAVDAALVAGQAALDRLLGEQSLLQFERALTTMDVTGLADPERRWAALMGRAQAGSIAMVTQVVADSSVAAIRLAARMGWVDRVAEAAITCADASDWIETPHETLGPILQQALRSASTPSDRVRLLLARASLESSRMDVPAARESAGEAIRIARDAGEWSWLLDAHASYWSVTGFGTPLEDELVLKRELITVVTSGGVVPTRRFRPLDNYVTYGRMVPAVRLGDRPGVEQGVTAAATTFTSVNRVAYHLWVAMLALADGRLDDVEQAIQRLDEEFPRFGDAGIFASLLRGEVLAERGDEEGLRLLEATAPLLGPVAPVLMVLVCNHEHAAGTGAPDRTPVIETGLRMLEDMAPAFFTGYGYALLAEAVGRHRRADWAARVEPPLRVLGGSYLSGMVGSRISPTGRALAQVLAVLGRLDEAVAAAEAAVTADECFGADGLLVRSRQWLASVLLERGRKGDAVRAAGELRRAVVDARRIGFVVVAEECQRLLDSYEHTER